MVCPWNLCNNAVHTPNLYTHGSFVHADDEDVCEGDMDKVDTIVNSITKSNTGGQSAATSQGDYQFRHYSPFGGEMPCLQPCEVV